MPAMNISIEVVNSELISRRTGRRGNGVWEWGLWNSSKWKDSVKGDTMMEQTARNFVIIVPWIQMHNVKGHCCTGHTYHPRQCCLRFEVKHIEVTNTTEFLEAIKILQRAWVLLS